MMSQVDAAPSSPKYVFVTGGVTSSLGKGILSASLGKLLQARGKKVTIQKFDPYLNVDPGTMSPYEHGECFVTDDGTEADLDLGHYERFLAVKTTAQNNVTTGRIYYDLINKERRGDFLGKTVQVIPHVTDAIKSHVYNLGKTSAYDIIIIEVGGCVGDIESHPFIEAIRQIKLELSRSGALSLHLTLVPYLNATGELKTKPTQQSVKGLLSLGIQPDILLCRSSRPLPLDLRKKIALYCNVPLESVIEAVDVQSIYEVPLLMAKEKLDLQVLSHLGLSAEKSDLSHWESFVKQLKSPKKEVKIALVGKYVNLKDAYMSIQEALTHAGVFHNCAIKIGWISAEALEKEAVDGHLGEFHGILLAPGFGTRGFKGKLRAADYAREAKVPFFGICLGMQCAVLTFAQKVLGLDANSTEMDANTDVPLIDLMKEQKQTTNKGGTMRLGRYACDLLRGSRAYEAYDRTKIFERHRHRYEINNQYTPALKGAGMSISGVNPETKLAEIVEISDHPWYVGCQFHPEYQSTVEEPHPLFVHFVRATLTFSEQSTKEQHV